MSRRVNERRERVRKGEKGEELVRSGCRVQSVTSHLTNDDVTSSDT